MLTGLVLLTLISAEHVTADEFSEYEALLIWLIWSIVCVPVVYTITKIARKILLNQEKRNNYKQKK